MIYEEIISNLMDLIEKIKVKSNVYIFGAGKAGKLTLFALQQLNISNIVLLDNDNAKWEKTISGFKIMSPRILNNFESNAIILVASYYYDEISKQLSVLGLKENIDYYPVVPSWKVEDYRKERIYNGVEVGKYTYGCENICKISANIVRIGAFCSINETARVVPNHPVSYITTHPFLYRHSGNSIGRERVAGLVDQDEVMNYSEISDNNGGVIIGNDVWIGANVIILPSLTIGNGAIIAAGAVVTKNVPDYAVVAGVPARVIKYRFTPQQIEVLNSIQWWNWPDEKIKENYKYFLKNDEFLKRFKVS